MTATAPQGEPQLQEQTFLSHLLELRDRLLRMIVVVVALFLVMFPFANDIYGIAAGPLVRHLPEGSSMIATRVISPFLAPLKLTFIMAVILAVPFLLYQLWSFVAPGLYRHEKRLALPLLTSSVLLFYLGMAFAYFVVFPLLFQILPSMAPEEITVSPDISDYLDFIITMFFAFGVAFEVPIAVILLVWMGVATPQALRGMRPYVIVGAFTIGMLLTPPDVFSQTLLAVPMCILFEVGVFFSRAFARNAEPEEDNEAAGVMPDVAPVSAESMAEAAGEREAEDPASRTVRRRSGEFVPLTEAELHAQVDPGKSAAAVGQERAVSAAANDAEPAPASVHAKLEQVAVYRDQQDEDKARRLLYEVLAEGDEEQVRVARNILAQLDEEF